MPDFDRRQQLADAAATALGAEPAETLMELLPPFPWHELATKTDLAELRTDLATKTDLAELRTELRSEMGGLASKTDLAELRADLVDTMATKGEVVDVRVDLSHVRNDLSKVTLQVSQLDLKVSQLAGSVERLVPQMWKSNLVFIAAMVGLLLVVAGLR